MSRIILHLDMDAFFAAIEERESPRFHGKPIVIGADPKVRAAPYGGELRPTGRGVVSTANYIAREYGIHSALPISTAYRLCPNAVFLPVNMDLYENVSGKIMEIVKKYSGQWEIGGLDELYLDISFIKDYAVAEDLARKLKKEISEKENLPCTIGIGPNKVIAKMASSKGKPNGLLIIKPEDVDRFLESLNVQELPGIGPKTAEKLNNIRINKIIDLKKSSREELKDLFGKAGESMYEKARGIDDSPVVSGGIVKSIGKEETFEKDTRDPEIIFNAFERIIKEIRLELQENKFSFKGITVVCRFQGFETHTKAISFKRPTSDTGMLEKESKKLLLKFLLENEKPIRLVGLRVKICECG